MEQRPRQRACHLFPEASARSVGPCQLSGHSLDTEVQDLLSGLELWDELLEDLS